MRLQDEGGLEAAGRMTVRDEDSSDGDDSKDGS